MQLLWFEFYIDETPINVATIEPLPKKRPFAIDQRTGFSCVVNICCFLSSGLLLFSSQSLAQ
jgi:hypothetical protein